MYKGGHMNNYMYNRKFCLGVPRPVVPYVMKGDTGATGPTGVTGATGPKGDKGDTGPQGESSFTSITVGNTETLVAGSQAEVTNAGTNEDIVLDFKIPMGVKGDKGDKGDTGEKGDTGPAGAGVGSTAYNAIFYTGFADTSDSKSLVLKDKVLIPDSTTIFKTPTASSFDVDTTGVYEITLCGKISGVTETNGGKFYLLNKTTGDIMTHLTFELEKGLTPSANFSATVITQIFAPASFEVKSAVSNNAIASQVEFSDITLMLKRFNM